jgi:hypothetical protein
VASGREIYVGVLEVLMRKLLGVLAAAGVMAGIGMAVATPAEAHGCCTYAKKVYYRTPVDHVVKKVSYVRVRSYRTVYVKRLYQDHCGCHRFYRDIAVQKPVVATVRKVDLVTVRSYRTVAAIRHYRRGCGCCRGWLW